MTYDLLIVGAGSGGLTAAGFAARLGVKVALVEKHRIGGDCTWTGCIPSKALLKAAKVAHEVRTSAHFGITTTPPAVDMSAVREYVRSAIEQVYRFESPEEIGRQGIDVIMGPAQFLDANTISVNGRAVRSSAFLIATGARPAVPAVEGLNEVPFLTYERIFDLDRLPGTLVILGAGPVGIEMAQAFRRLGSQVIVIAEKLLPKEEPEAREVIQRVLEREGVEFVIGRAVSARTADAGVVVATVGREVRGDTLLVAAGRAPVVDGLSLEKAGVEYSAKGIPVDDRLRTNVKNIYAAGDVAGGYQFTHFAGWQAFQAVRNALLPGHSSGFSDVVPWVTFTDPEVAHIGLTEVEAREKFGSAIQILKREAARIDRAICENDTDGFIKLIAEKDGAIIGGTIVAARAGEAIAEIAVAMRQGMKMTDLAGAIHPYPTYSTAIQQMAAGMAIEGLLAGASGKLILGLSKIIR